MTQRSTLNQIQNLIIDMDGVLYRGDAPIPGTSEFLAFLRRQGIGFVMATNNSTRTPDQYVTKLASMDVSIEASEVLTSAQATAAHLRAHTPNGTRVFFVGQDGLKAALESEGFVLVEHEPQYVVVGMDFDLRYQRLAEATLHIRAGAKFVGTNPDRTFPSERGIVPGAGALLAFLEAATDVTPTVIGKPGTAMMEQAIERMAACARTTAMLGDRLETDILAGQRAGLCTLLVLSGVTDSAMLSASSIQPDCVFDDIAVLHAEWEKALRE